MSDSILTSIKKLLGIEESYTPFDVDIVMHINTALSTLDDLGIGPNGGFFITNKDATWDQFLGTNEVYYDSIKSYVYLRVRMLFDPPATGFHVSAMDAQIKEFEWRLSQRREAKDWVDPTPVDLEPDFDGTVTIDGGPI